MTPIPPLETSAQALVFEEVRAAYDHPGGITAGNSEYLHAVLGDAGVAAGAWDEEVLGGLARLEPFQVASFAGFVQRAHEAGKRAGRRQALRGCGPDAEAEAWGGRGPSASYAEWLADEDGGDGGE